MMLTRIYIWWPLELSVLQQKKTHTNRHEVVQWRKSRIKAIKYNTKTETLQVSQKNRTVKVSRVHINLLNMLRHAQLVTMVLNRVVTYSMT